MENIPIAMTAVDLRALLVELSIKTASVYKGEKDQALLRVFGQANLERILALHNNLSLLNVGDRLAFSSFVRQTLNQTKLCLS